MLNLESALNPCGILPKYLFTDSFELISRQNYTRIIIDEENIASDYDKKYKFKKTEGDSDQVQWLDVTNGNYTHPNCCSPYFLTCYNLY